MAPIKYSVTAKTAETRQGYSENNLLGRSPFSLAVKPHQQQQQKQQQQIP